MTISKNLWKLAAFLLVMCLISAAMISGTFAKYTSTYAGEDTALVAKWEVNGTGGIFTTSGTGIDLDLFSHANYSHMNNTSGSAYIIAPGVADSFVIQFDNNSDVDAEIAFEVTKTAISADVPILYSFATPVAIATGAFEADELESNLNATFGTIAADPTSSAGPVSQTVYWSWLFDVSDAQNQTDTTLGIQSAADDRSEYGLTITATAIQVQPE